MSSDFTRAHDGDPHARRRARRASARTSPTTRSTTSRSRTPGRCSDARRLVDARELLRARRGARPVPAPSRCATCRGCTAAGRSRAPRSTSRCARPALPLREALGREPRPVTFVVSLRLGEPADDRAGAQAGSTRYPTLRFKLDPTSEWTRRADRASWSRRARSTRSTSRASTRARSSTSRPTPSSTGGWRRRSRTPGSRIPALTDETRPVLEPHQRPHHVGRADPLDRRHRGAAVPAADGEREAVALRRPARRCCDAYD